MAGLHFDITADNQNFIRRLREIEHGIENTSKQVQIEGKKMDSAFNIGDTLKKQIHEGSQSVNGLTAQIIKQKAVIKDVEHDVRNLGEAYRKAGAGTAKGNALFADFKSAKSSLQEEKTGLFDLQTQQAQARLSVRKLKDEYSLYQKGGQDVVDSNNNMAISFKKTLAAIGGTAMIQKFVSDVVRVRGEFQQLDVAFTTLLQSKEKANALMAQMVQTAANTPFNLTELAAGAKQLVAYGFASEGVNDTLIRLGNIASGLGLPLERLTHLYGTTMTQGRLYARDLMQFTTSGIPMLQGLADMYGVSTNKVNEMVTAGKIGFPEVQKVIENLTNEGGKFFNLMQEQSKTITGRISNLGDAWDTMLNKIGESQEGVINDSIDGLKYLVENYEQVGRILIGVIELYGTYRAALLANAIIEQGFTKAIWGKVTATKAAAIAQTAFNKVLKGNIYVAIASAALSFGIAMWALADHTTTAEKAQKRFNDSLAAQKQRLDDAKKSAVELISTIKSETATHYDKMAAYLKLQGIMPEVFKNMDIEKLKLMDILSYNKLIAEEINRRERVGAKTSLVLKTNAYSEAKERYSKTSSRNSNILTYYAQMKAAEEDMKLAQKQVDDIEKIQSEANKQKGKESKKVVVENKEFWDKQKKDAETALDSIDSKQRKLLNAGKFNGIDAAVVSNYKNQSKLLEEAQKELKVYDTSGKSEKQQESSAEKLRKEQEKYNLLLDKQSREQKRMEEDSANELEQLEIDRLKDGSEKILRQRVLNHEKELEAIKREAQDKKAKAIEEGRAAHESNPDDKKKPFNAEDFIKSEPVKKQFASFDNVATVKTKTANTQYNRGDDLSGLLNEYQDYTDKRLAIETKFNNDLAVLDEQRKQAVKNGDTQQVEQIDRAKAQATTDKGKSLMGMDYDKLKESPEYVRAFENLKETSSETLNSLLSQLENAKGTAAKVLSPDQLREYTTTIQEIMNELDERNPFQALSDKKQELADAEQELAQAQIALENARQTAETVKGGGKVEYTTTKFNKETGKSDSTKAYLTEAQALENVKDKTNDYNKSKDNAVKASSKVRKSEKEVRDVIDDLSKSISDVGNSIGGPAGEIISLIGNIGSFAMMAMSGVETASKTASTAIQTVEKASVILAIISAAIQIATKMLDLFGGDDTTEKYESTKEAYESYINILDQVIDKQLEMAESLSGASAQAAYNKAIELVKTQSEAAKVLGKQYLNSGASWKSSSKGKKEVEDMSSDGWADAAKALGMSVDQIKNTLGGRMDGLFDLTDEQLAKLQGEAHIFWAQLDDDTQDYANQITEGVAKIAEVIEQRMADVTLIDVDTLRSDFHDLLTDMDADTADFADNFEEYMKNAILNSMLKEQYMGRLTEWRKKFYAATDNGVTEEEYNALKAEGQQIADEMKEDRDNMKDMYGWTSGESSSQDSTNGGFQAMSQDTGDELNGRFTALQISNEEIKNSMLSMLVSMNLISVSTNTSGITLMEIKNIALMSNSHLEDIAKYTKELIGFKQTIANIETSAKAMAGK